MVAGACVEVVVEEVVGASVTVVDVVDELVEDGIAPSFAPPQDVAKTSTQSAPPTIRLIVLSETTRKSLRGQGENCSVLTLDEDNGNNMK